MKAYCHSDVKLLKEGCRKFRQEFQERAEFDPIEKCITIASACNRYWRKMQVPLNTIASKPPRGWFGARSNQSIKALKWLAFCDHQLRVNHALTEDRLRTVRNSGEVRVANYLVDVYDACDPDTQRPTVYEFYGCLWHGCPTCFPHRRDRYSILHADRTMPEVYESTLRKQDILRQRGYALRTKWECEWDWEVELDLPLKQFLNTFEVVEPLEPRDAFFGGRTNAVKLNHVADEVPGEKIHYADVTSLYHWVNKTKQ